MDVAEADFGLARDLGLMISMHHSGGETPPGAWERLDERRLLGPHVNVVHGNTIDTELLRRLVDLGVTFTVTPEVELGDGHGQPITGRLRALKTAPSLGVDIESAVSGEMLIVARLALAHQRSLDHAAAQREGRAMEFIPAREALAWATIEGARALGLADRIGTLEVGKQADLVIIDPRHLNLWPANDIVAASLQASLCKYRGGDDRREMAQAGRATCLPRHGPPTREVEGVRGTHHSRSRAVWLGRRRQADGASLVVSFQEVAHLETRALVKGFGCRPSLTVGLGPGPALESLPRK